MRAGASRISVLLDALTDRDVELLRELSICRHLRVEQLGRLFFPNASLDRVSQRMRWLAARGLVRNVRYAHDGVTRYSYWHVTSPALTLCHTLEPEGVIPYKTEADVRLRPHFLPHSADTAEVRVQLELMLRAGAMRDYLYQTGPTARVEVTELGGQVRRASADALVAVRMPWPNVWWIYWAEIDESTMTRAAMSTKAARIKRLLELHDRHPDPARPWLVGRYLTLILVCSPERRRQWLGDAFRAAGFTGHGHPQVWTLASPAAAARAIVEGVREGDRQHAEQERRRAEAVAMQRQRDVEERRRAEQLERARENMLRCSNCGRRRSLTAKVHGSDDRSRIYDRTMPASIHSRRPIQRAPSKGY